MEEWLIKVPLKEDYYDNYLYPDVELKRAIAEWCEYCPKVLDWRGYHCKFGIVIDDPIPKEDYNQILKIYDTIKDAYISPVLIHNEILYDKGTIFVYLLVTEIYGKDLGVLFMEGKYFAMGRSSMDILHNNYLFHDIFPKDRIPKNIRHQIRDILWKFQELGWIHNDVWCFNILLKDGIVKLIDFEYCTKINPKN